MSRLREKGFVPRAKHPRGQGEPGKGEMDDMWAVFIPCGDSEQLFYLARLKSDARAIADSCNGRVCRVSLKDVGQDKVEINEK